MRAIDNTSRTDWPSFLRWLIELTNTTPFRTATPKRAMKRQTPRGSGLDRGTKGRYSADEGQLDCLQATSTDCLTDWNIV